MGKLRSQKKYKHISHQTCIQTKQWIHAVVHPEVPIILVQRPSICFASLDFLLVKKKNEQEDVWKDVWEDLIPLDMNTKSWGGKQKITILQLNFYLDGTSPLI